jgi:adenylate cyclase
VESLAEGGGICISGNAFDQVKNKLDLEYEFLGEKEVKNIAEPVRVYRVRLKPGVEISVSKPERSPGFKRWQWSAMVVLVLLIAGLITFAIWKHYPPSAPVLDKVSQEKITEVPSEKPEAQPPSPIPKELSPEEKKIFPPTAKPAMEVASVKEMAYPLPDKPSIAVLPFVNMSDDPKQGYLSDGITENIITGLSKIPRIFVIARNSTFFYKGKGVKVQKVAEELGVRYVLEGSVQRSGNRLRVTAQLIDAITGNHLWAERYDRDLRDIFAVQDEITMKILQSMRVKLTEGEQDLRGNPPRNLEAFLKILQTQEYIQRFNIESNIMGKRLAEEGIALDPEFARAYHCLASAHLMDVWLGLSKSPKESLDKAIELTQKAISLDPRDSRPYAQLGYLYAMKRDYEKAIAEGEKAVALDPGGADAHAWLGQSLNYADKPKEAIPLFEKAIRLNPNGPTWYFLNFGHSFRFMGKYQEAITQYKRALRVAPNNIMAHLGLAGTYSLLGRDEEARAEAEEVLRLNPKFSLESFAKTLPLKNQTQIDRYIEGLRKAGLK